MKKKSELRERGGYTVITKYNSCIWIIQFVSIKIVCVPLFSSFYIALTHLHFSTYSFDLYILHCIFRSFTLEIK